MNLETTGSILLHVVHYVDNIGRCNTKHLQSTVVSSHNHRLVHLHYLIHEIARRTIATLLDIVESLTLRIVASINAEVKNYICGKFKYQMLNEMYIVIVGAK